MGVSGYARWNRNRYIIFSNIIVLDYILNEEFGWTSLTRVKCRDAQNLKHGGYVFIEI